MTASCLLLNYTHLPTSIPTYEPSTLRTYIGIHQVVTSPSERRLIHARLALRPTRHHGTCNSFPDTSNILVVIKTGATESYARIPLQLVTTLRCLPDFLIFSDMEQNIAGYHVYDSLDTLLPEVTKGNQDFNLYRRQKACVVDQQSCNSNGNLGSEFDGWILDKYKNVHIIEKTYKLRPDYDWYLFIDADTYVLWNNLAQWLRQLETLPKERYYIGSVALTNEFRFAHGGSGYILSQWTMKEFVGNHSGIANQYDMKAKESCCGDVVLALALNETIGVGVRYAWPTINGEKPFTIPYGPREWCHPLVTMHHMNLEEISSFWKFEKQFYESQGAPQATIRFRDIYHEFVEPKLKPRRDDWDNMSEDVVYLDPNRGDTFLPWQREKDRLKKLQHQLHVPSIEMNAYKSFEDCRKLCKTVNDCFQFSYHAGACIYNKSFRLGKPTMKAGNRDDKWISGWDVERIQAWVEEQGQCDDPVWPNFRQGF
ncbi:glycosyltransferase family 31 protein [Annulohypoxylon truncatum]|uniref:glycosyltransferase family 31 protein n=1 Tax=Annulohypoxylon truncatum TaxID=327061 RepID=UPI002008D225|nr:glycosyltransferase family 31 protein [Annulohypoxylon truncatum]KAI1214372.1 glycosyltransferase family 31 protein [Annulohypoxylon truncatum]